MRESRFDSSAIAAVSQEQKRFSPHICRAIALSLIRLVRFFSLYFDQSMVATLFFDESCSQTSPLRSRLERDLAQFNERNRETQRNASIALGVARFSSSYHLIEMTRGKLTKRASRENRDTSIFPRRDGGHERSSGPSRQGDSLQLKHVIRLSGSTRFAGNNQLAEIKRNYDEREEYSSQKRVANTSRRSVCPFARRANWCQLLDDGEKMRKTIAGHGENR